MDATKNKSLFQERLIGLYLRLNGYLQSGYISHSKTWGHVGTDIDRIAVRFPKHSQIEREINFSLSLKIPNNSIDIIIAEVKNNCLEFNETITNPIKNAEENWKHLLSWIGLFDSEEIINLIPKLINSASTHGEKINDTFAVVEHSNSFGLITIRPMLFVLDKNQEENGKIWINGSEVIEYIWECFCPEFRREECSTRYPLELWGNEYTDIVNYMKTRDKNGLGSGTLNEMYSNLLH